MNSSRLGSRPLPEWVWLVLLLALSSFAVGPLLLPGYHWGAQDARHSVYFLHQFHRAIADGILYPRWAPDFTFGYGYPFFNIYGPLSCYLGEAFLLAGLDLVSAVKAVFALAAIASAFTMYLWLRLYAAPPAALIGGLLYLYAPYHIVDLYVRASLAETLGLAFLPLCLWAFGRLLGAGRPVHRAGLPAAGAFAYAGLMLSSNLLALLFSPLLGGYMVVLLLGRYLDERGARRPLSSQAALLVRRALPAGAALALGLGLSAIFWLPGFLEYRYVRTDQWVGGYYEYQNHFVGLWQLFGLEWGFGASVPGADDGMSFQLGVAPLVLAGFGLLLWRQAQARWRHAAAYFLAVTIALGFLTLEPSRPLWEALGLVRFAQFPWRLLALVVLSLAFVATTAFVAWADEGRAALPALLIALLVILPVYPYLRSEVRPPAEGEVSLRGLMRFQQSADEMTGSTAWVREIPRWSPLADQIMAGIPITTKVDYALAHGSGKLAVHSMEMGTTYEKVWFQAEDDEQRLRFHTFYYPGWTAYVLDEESEAVQAVVPVEPEGELGLITVPLPRGRHILLLRFEDTPLRRAGTVISGVSLALCLGLLAFGPPRRRVPA